MDFHQNDIRSSASVVLNDTHEDQTTVACATAKVHPCFVMELPKTVCLSLSIGVVFPYDNSLPSILVLKQFAPPFL